MPVPYSIQRGSNEKKNGYWFCSILAVKLRLIEELRGGSKSTNTLQDLKLNDFLHTQFWNWQYPVTSVGFGIAVFYKHLLL